MSANGASQPPASGSVQPPPVVSNNTGGKQAATLQSSLTPPVKCLEYADLVVVCQALGGTPGRIPIKAPSNSASKTVPGSSVDEKDVSVGIQHDDEEKQLTYAPAVSAPYGLYKRVVDNRKSAWWKFQLLAFVYNACLVLQLVLGATLTALAASDRKKSLALTVIAALNTVNAGLIALLHNSGIPTRYRNDWDEWSKVELYMSDIMQSGVVPSNMAKEDVIATCQAMYIAAFATVENNKPSSYVPTVATAVTGGPKNGLTGQSSSSNNNAALFDLQLA